MGTGKYSVKGPTVSNRIARNIISGRIKSEDIPNTSFKLGLNVTRAIYNKASTYGPIHLKDAREKSNSFEKGVKIAERFRRINDRRGVDPVTKTTVRIGSVPQQSASSGTPVGNFNGSAIRPDGSINPLSKDEQASRAVVDRHKESLGRGPENENIDAEGRSVLSSGQRKADAHHERYKATQADILDHQAAQLEKKGRYFTAKGQGLVTVRGGPKEAAALRAKAASLRGSRGDDQPRVPAGNPDGGQWTKG